jgi:hypothetical protein
VESLATEDAGIFYGHLVYFMVIGYNLWSFGIFYGNLVYFVAIWYILWPFGIFYDNFGICNGNLVYFLVIWYIFPILVCILNHKKIWQPWRREEEGHFFLLKESRQLLTRS